MMMKNSSSDFLLFDSTSPLREVAGINTGMLMQSSLRNFTLTNSFGDFLSATKLQDEHVLGV